MRVRGGRFWFRVEGGQGDDGGGWDRGTGEGGTGGRGRVGGYLLVTC